MRLVDTLCIELTNSCPLTCLHCSVGASPQGRQRITAPDLYACLEELSPLAEIYLSGGEPFTYPEIIQAVHAAAYCAGKVVIYSSGIQPSGSTNEPLSINLIREALYAGLNRIDLSFYSAHAPAHDAVTKFQGSFAATLETARRVSSTGLSLGIHYVPIAYRPNDIHALVQLAEELSASRLHLLALAPQGRASTLPQNLAHNPQIIEELRWLSQSSQSFEVIISSVLRFAAGLDTLTARDKFLTAVLDHAGYFYPREDRRSQKWRSRSAIGCDTSATELLREVIERFNAAE